MSNRKLVILFFSFTIVYLSTVGLYRFLFTADSVIWEMVDISGDESTGDAHLLRFPDGHVILVDSGSEASASQHLIPFLDGQGIKQIDQLVISHAHADNYGGTPALLTHLESVGEVVFNFPDRSACEEDTVDLTCDWQQLESLQSTLASAGIRHRDARTGDIIYHDPDRDISVLVLHAHDGSSKPLGRTGLNDTSMVLLLQYADLRALFTSDLGSKAAHHLTQRGVLVGATLATAPHHGVDSAAGNRFLNAVNPEAVLVSASAPVWRGSDAERMRSYLAIKGVPAYVSGLHGNVMVEIMPADYKVHPEVIPSEDTDTSGDG